MEVMTRSALDYVTGFPDWDIGVSTLPQKQHPLFFVKTLLNLQTD